MFTLLLPAEFDGQETNFLEYLALIESAANADGSTGWCLNQNNVLATFAAVMPRSLAQEVWATKTSILANGPPVTVSVEKQNRGLVLTGEWRLSSGFAHADWLLAALPREQHEDKGCMIFRKPYAVLPKKNVERIDDWNVAGLRGTGSNSFKTRDLFVPEHRIFYDEPPKSEDKSFYRIPRDLLFAAGFATVALGIARGSIDDARTIALTKAPQDQVFLKEQEMVQYQAGRMEALWQSCRSYLLNSVDQLLQNDGKSEYPKDLRIQVRLASTHAIRVSADIVDTAYAMAGSQAVFESSPVHRRFQDIHAIVQQIQGRLVHYRTAGQYFLGLEPEESTF
ncbi:MAG: hypothetical protein CL896_01325 [Dehalococcoidia bacterium]|nr:hypothetical protein [Dehalococcoidia bacterium]|tara:strand:+ start:7607 stop:8620 length:1014 start_codon:yes stop_codon:yes gene_type:complete